jgi:C1A family cysteine protease
MGNILGTDEKKFYGWIPDKLDNRDKYIKFKDKHYNNLKPKIDLRDSFDNIYDQGKLNSCTSNAICGAFIYDQKKKQLPSFEPSRMFLYYNYRLIKHNTEQDSGASIRNSLKTINKQGICGEKLWSYELENFNKKPNDSCYRKSIFNNSLKYRRVVHDLKELKTALSNNHPIIFGFNVFSNFENFNASKDIMPNPEENNDKIIGKHVGIAVGYSDDKECFLIQNSWGKEWGIDGYFMMPYSFIESIHCSDFWVLDIIVNKDKNKNKYEKVTINFVDKKKEKVNIDVIDKDNKKDGENGENGEKKKDRDRDGDGVIKVFVEKKHQKLNNDCMILDED